MLLVAANHLLDVFELVYSTRGVTYGASYTDVRAEMPALYIMAAVARDCGAADPASAPSPARSGRPSPGWRPGRWSPSSAGCSSRT